MPGSFGVSYYDVDNVAEEPFDIERTVAVVGMLAPGEYTVADSLSVGSEQFVVLSGCIV